MDSSYWSLFVILGEPTNTIDQYAVAVIRSGLVVGHLPKKISRVCSLFLRRGGTIILYSHQHQEIFRKPPSKWIRDPLYFAF